MALRARLPMLMADGCADDDRSLLRRFAEARDESAFAAVVARHARMVYGVCRRAIRDEHLAEDAFQAVFLVLADHPARAIRASAVGGWLFGVARRVGLAARRREERYAKRQRPTRPESDAARPADFDDLLCVLDEELSALPDEFRAPLVATYLEERTLDEAARQLAWSVSTLRRRLDGAKELLRARLTARGAALSTGLFAGFLASSARAAIPARAMHAVLRGSSASARATTLAAEATRGSISFKVGLAAIVVSLGLAFGVGAARDQSKAAPPNPGPPDIALAAAPLPIEARWPTVRGRVVFPDNKAIPIPRAVLPDLIKDVEFFGVQTYRDAIIDAKTRGIANVVVWLRPDTDNLMDEFPADAIHPSLMRAKPVDRPVLLTHEGYAPRVVAGRAGDRVVFSNTTPVFFTVHYETPGGSPRENGENRQFNVLLPPGQTHASAPLPGSWTRDSLTDNIHPWVHGTIWSFDHPYFAVTDAEGEFAIESAPPGAWRLVAWHEKAGYRDGPAGRLGERITIAPVTKLKPIVLMSPKWDD